MNLSKLRWSVLCCIPFAAGCPFTVPPPDDSCPLTEIERDFIEEIVEKVFGDALFVAQMTHDLERAYALTLIGVDEGSLGIAFLVEGCSQATTFEPTCDSGGLPPGEDVPEFWQTHDRCGQFACEAENIGIARVYLTTQPHTDPDDRHAFSYEITAPAGTITYDPNPRVDWQIDQTDPQELVVEADLSQAITIDLASGDSLDLSFSGEVTLSKTVDDVLSGRMDLSFSGLGDGPVQAAVELAANGDIIGTIKAGNRTIAALGGSLARAPHFQWDQNCP